MNRYFYLLSLALFLISCHKDEVIFVPDQNSQISRDAFFSSISDTSVTYQVISDGQDLTVFLPGQAILQLPGGAMTATNGNPVTGTVKVLYEDTGHKRAELLRAPSLSYGNSLLDSRQLIKISFEQDGKPLKLNADAYIYMPSDINNEEYRLFYAESSESKWQQAAGSGQFVQSRKWEVIYKDGMVSLTGFRIPVSSYGGWYCIGTTENGNISSAGLTVELPSGFNSSNTLVFWLSNKPRTAIRLEAQGKSSVFRTPAVQATDLAEGKLVSVSDLGGDNYFFGTRNAVLLKDAATSLTPQKHNLSDIKILLQKL